MNGFDQTLRISVGDHNPGARYHLIFGAASAVPVGLAQLPAWTRLGAGLIPAMFLLSLLHDRIRHRGLFAFRDVILDENDCWRVLRPTAAPPGMTEENARLIRHLNWPSLIVLWLATEDGCRGSLWLRPWSMVDSEWRRLRGRLRLL